MEKNLLNSIKTIRFGGDKIYTSKAGKLFSVLPNITIISTCGPTETTFFCFCKKLRIDNFKDHATDIITIGTPIPDRNMYLKYSEEQEVGEIVICGDYIGDGYLNDNKAFSIEKI